MEALSGPYEKRAAAIIAAGLDIVLHCNGELNEARAVASAVPLLSGRSLRRANAALATIASPKPFNAEQAANELSAVHQALQAG